MFRIFANIKSKLISVMNKAISMALVKERELAQLVAPGIKKPEAPGPDSEIPDTLPAPVGPGVTL